MHLGLHGRAVRLLHHHGIPPEAQRAIVMARRRLQVSEPISPSLVDTAFHRAGADPSVRRIEQTIVGGQGSDVESVVRYRDANGRSIIRKTLRGDLPREVSAYASGLLDDGERYRPPALIHHAADRPDRRHLFLEDLGRLEPLATPQEFITAAQALGELNGRWLDRDDDLAAQHPWLLKRDPWDLPDYRTLLKRSQVLTYHLPEVTVAQCGSVLGDLARHEDDLRDRIAALPLTLCHGDATRSNIAVRDGQVIMFDLPALGIEHVGRDLADVLGLPNRLVPRGQLAIQDCLDAYAAGLREGGAVVDDDLVAFGYRARFVRKAFWWLFMTIPRRLAPDAEALDVRRRNIATDLARVCAEAAQLVEAVVRAPRSHTLTTARTSPASGPSPDRCTGPWRPR